MNVVRKYTSFEELTPTLLREFVEKIVVHECSYDENGTRRQDIDCLLYTSYEISQSEFIRQAIRKATIRPIVTVSPVNDGLLAALSKLCLLYTSAFQSLPGHRR